LIDIASQSRSQAFFSQAEVSLPLLLEALPAIAVTSGYKAAEFSLSGTLPGQTPLDRIVDHVDTVVLDHMLGGGSRLYINQCINSLLLAGSSVHTIAYDSSSSRYLLIQHGCPDDCLWFFESLEEINRLYTERSIGKLIINSLIGFPRASDCVEFILQVSSRHCAAIAYLVHDYYSICPSMHLLNSSNQYCNVPLNEEVCVACARDNIHMDSLLGAGFNVGAWRQPFQELFEECDEIIFFDLSSISIFERAHQVAKDRFRIQPHKHFIQLKPVVAAKQALLHIGVLGSLHQCKGIERVNELSRYIVDQQLGTQITLIGSSSFPLEPQISVTGEYSLIDLGTIVAACGVTVFFLSSIVPETFSYTLDEIMAMNMPVLSYALGAQGRRTKLYSKGLAIDCASTAEEVYHHISSLHNKFYSDFELCH
jgi:hypothetical protein